MERTPSRSCTTRRSGSYGRKAEDAGIAVSIRDRVLTECASDALANKAGATLSAAVEARGSPYGVPGAPPWRARSMGRRSIRSIRSDRVATSKGLRMMSGVSTSSLSSSSA